MEIPKIIMPDNLPDIPLPPMEYSSIDLPPLVSWTPLLKCRDCESTNCFDFKALPDGYFLCKNCIEQCLHKNLSYYGDTNPSTYICQDCGAFIVKE